MFAAVRATEVHLAWQLFLRDKGTNPVSLADLVPHYLPSVPIDPFSGDPLALSSDPVTVHSVGPTVIPVQYGEIHTGGRISFPME
ncbi:MAG: hypothetical protein AAF581_10575 [Planctomycetota bacterium]